MAKSKFAKRYPRQFHRQMVELVRAGRSRAMENYLHANTNSLTRYARTLDMLTDDRVRCALYPAIATGSPKCTSASTKSRSTAG